MATKKKAAMDRTTSLNPWIRNSVLLLCSLGIFISAYAYYVEISKERDGSYRAFCDFSEVISCSKVFTSRWGRGFGLVEMIAGRDSLLNQPNSIFGMAFYAFQTTLAFYSSSVCAMVQLGGSVIANLGSVYLGYILFFILHDVCVVCMTMYVINFLLLIVCVAKYKQSVAAEMKKKR